MVSLEEFGRRPVALVFELAVVVTEGRIPNSSIPVLLAVEEECLCAERTPKPKPAPYPMSSALPSGRVLDGVVVMAAEGRWRGRVAARGAGSTLIA